MVFIFLVAHLNKALNPYLTKLDLCSTQSGELMEESGLFYRPKMFRLDPEKAKNIQDWGFKRSVQELYPYSHPLHPHFVKYDNLIAFWIPEIVVIESKLFKVEDEPLSEPSSESEPLSVGVIRNGNYFGFYMEIPSYEDFINRHGEKGSLIRLSMSEINSDTLPGTHLIAISSPDCSLKENNEIDLSSSDILNYYRQFLWKLRNVKTSFEPYF